MKKVIILLFSIPTLSMGMMRAPQALATRWINSCLQKLSTRVYIPKRTYAESSRYDELASKYPALNAKYPDLFSKVKQAFLQHWKIVDKKLDKEELFTKEKMRWIQSTKKNKKERLALHIRRIKNDIDALKLEETAAFDKYWDLKKLSEKQSTICL